MKGFSKISLTDFPIPCTLGYRFSFNGMESDDEISGRGNLNTTEFRELDTRLGGRWWSTDRIVKPWESPYAGFSNNPIYFIDPEGLDSKDRKEKRQGRKDGKGTKYSADNNKRKIEGTGGQTFNDLCKCYIDDSVTKASEKSISTSIQRAGEFLNKLASQIINFFEKGGLAVNIKGPDSDNNPVPLKSRRYHTLITIDYSLFYLANNQILLINPIMKGNFPKRYPDVTQQSKPLEVNGRLQNNLSTVPEEDLARDSNIRILSRRSYWMDFHQVNTWSPVDTAVPKNNVKNLFKSKRFMPLDVK